MNHLIEKAEKMLQSKAGYRYNPKVLAQVIEAGEIPEGVTLMSAGGQVIQRQGAEIVCIKDGQITKRTPLDEAAREMALMQYAIKRAQSEGR